MGLFYSRFGGGGETTMTAVGFICVALAIVLILLLSRKYVLTPILMVAFLMTMGQTLVIGGLHFMAIRIIIVAGWARIILGKKEERLQLNALDKAFILWNISSVIFFTILWHSSDAFVNRLGALYTAIGIYFLFRYFCRNFEDIDRLIKFLSGVTVILATCMVLEQVTGRNLFSIFGGVPAFTVIRDGSLRSQATFGNAILAGIFGATLLPIFVGSWLYLKKSRVSSAMGAIFALIMIFTSRSSTPLMSLMAVIIGFSLWPMRRKMRLLRWGIVIGLISLHLVMKAPVWALIGRVDIAGGSAQQRQALVDAFIRHFWDWFLIGSRDYANWNWYSVDLDNQYVYEGVNGGILTFGLFVSTIVYAFKLIGRARKAMDGIDRSAELRMWTFGVALFAQMTAFMGVSYFDNSTVGWFALLAMIQAAAATILLAPAAQPEPALAPLGVIGTPLPPPLPGLARGKAASNVPVLGLNRKSVSL